MKACNRFFLSTFQMGFLTKNGTSRRSQSTVHRSVEVSEILGSPRPGPVLEKGKSGIPYQTRRPRIQAGRPTVSQGSPKGLLRVSLRSGVI